eukprot:m.1261132 g.1261132  ORF g.1261132 m.1261132 type:complete len:676 (+) comp24730_c0_seq9:307-2334(+)
MFERTRLAALVGVVGMCCSAEAQPGSCGIDCPTSTGHGADKAGTCLNFLNNERVWEDYILPDSASTLNSLGAYHRCKYLPGNEVLSGYKMCVLDVLDSTREFTVITQGICLPDICDGMLIEALIKQLVDCKNGSTLLSNYTSKECSGLDQSIVQKTIQQWNVSARLPQIQAYTHYNSENIEFHCGDNDDTTLNPLGIVMLSLTAILILLCITSELVEQSEQRQLMESQHATNSLNNTSRGANRSLLGRKERKNWSYWRKLLKTFCPSDTIHSLLERSASRTLAGLDGLRSISMMWIILAHTQLLSLSLGTDNENAEHLMTETLPQQFSLGSSLAIDIFFFLSGLLTTYTLLRRMRKNRKNSFPAHTFIGLRYLRLTPLYAYILLCYASVAVHFGEGPVWFRLSREASLCTEYWWSNLVYANNFFPHRYHSSCMPWSWYLACDMQYFIIGLFILTVYLRTRIVGLFLSVALVVCGVVSGYLLLLHYSDTQDDYFDKPYTRVTPFGVGILLGILLVDLDWIHVRIRSSVSYVLMLVSLVVMGGVIYVDYVNFTPTAKPWSAEADAAYQAFGRLAFAIAVATVTFLCVNENRGIVNWVLSLSLWEPLGKLTYGAYLVHPIIIRCYYFQQVMLFHYMPFNQFVVFVAMVFISYVVAAMLHVLVELPFASITKLIVTSRR